MLSYLAERQNESKDKMNQKMFSHLAEWQNELLQIFESVMHLQHTIRSMKQLVSIMVYMKRVSMIIYMKKVSKKQVSMMVYMKKGIHGGINEIGIHEIGIHDGINETGINDGVHTCGMVSMKQV